MSLREKLASLASVIADEAERNSGFRRQLEAALTGQSSRASSPPTRTWGAPMFTEREVGELHQLSTRWF